MNQELKAGDQIVLTTLDDPDPSWKYEEYDTALSELRQYFKVGDILTIDTVYRFSESLDFYFINSEGNEEISYDYSINRFRKYDPFVEAVRKANNLI